MSEVSGDIQPSRLEPVPPEFLAGQPAKEKVDKVASGYHQSNSVSQGQAARTEDFPVASVIPVPALQPALPGAMVASSEEIKGLLSTALVIRDSLGQKSTGAAAEPLPGGLSASLSEAASGQPPQERSTVDNQAAGTQRSTVNVPASTPLQDMVTKVQSALPEATDTDEVLGVYESNVRQLTETIQQALAAGSSAPLQVLSVVAADVFPSDANSGSLVLQRVIDNIVSINRNSGESSVHSGKGIQQNSADLYGMPEHVRLSLLSQRLGIDLQPLIRTREEFLESILVAQRGILLAIEAMSNAEFFELLKERLREEQIKEDLVKEGQHKEVVDKLKQAIAALKAGEPTVAAEVLNSASLITTAIEQIVDRYTSDETPGSLRQHLQEHLTRVLDSVTQQGSYQDMMNKRVELLQSAKKV
ncbi:hypothetical protein [Endozoicomonas sp. GU-1]|uniref:hypothetical protein n=1 Tax=Endozoicomonas sp. GU-1 TaxID=3009078 RepID=UPI0022B4D9ED|nr:hypothetical protein [Endozoicomonas sp. GU-1]WBA79878.1 hypothetical protein O2T12_16080 [Endozoicomonas sp. GU-1]WBA87453.1 hypothetical protein O3276_05315 [Endozoicomonas sp. GU-1]